MFDWRTHRANSGKTTSEMAELLRVSQATYSRYEAGKIRMPLDVAYRLATILGNKKLWYDWMRSEYKSSYGTVFPELLSVSKPIASLFFDKAYDELLEESRVLIDGYVKGRLSKIDAVRIDRCISDLIMGAMTLKMMNQQ